MRRASIAAGTHEPAPGDWWQRGVRRELFLAGGGLGRRFEFDSASCILMVPSPGVPLCVVDHTRVITFPSGQPALGRATRIAPRGRARV